MTPPPGIIEAIPGVWAVENDSHYLGWIRQHDSLLCDPALFEWLRPHLEGVDVCYDIGSCLGDHAAFYLSLGKTVIAVEPNPLSYLCLAHNCLEATCLNIAASDEPGILRFAVSGNVGASRISENGMTVVEAAALDDLDLPAPGFVKIDTEGYEARALRGMAKTILAHHPICYIEINRGALAEQGFTPEDITSFMEAAGYSEKKFYPPNAEWSWPQFDILFLP